MPRIGDRRLLVTFQTKDLTQTAKLDPSGNWIDAFQDYISLRPMTGREMMAAQAPQNVGNFVVEMRWRAGVKPNMRIKYVDPGEGSTHYYNITSPPRNVGMRYTELQFDVQEGLRNG